MSRERDTGSDRTRTGAQTTAAEAALSERERAVIAALRDVDFGEVGVVVHNARIVQITRSKKLRFPDG